MDFLEKRMLQKRHCDQETNYFQEGIVTLIMEFSPYICTFRMKSKEEYSVLSSNLSPYPEFFFK